MTEKQLTLVVAQRRAPRWLGRLLVVTPEGNAVDHCTQLVRTQYCRPASEILGLAQTF